MPISTFDIVISTAAAVILFIYALKGFSRDVRETGGEQLSNWIAKVTANPVKGFIRGALLTALIQSSSAVSGITVALVEAGTILFRSSLPVFLGANLGTTSTAWLVSLDLTTLGPFLIVASVLISWLPGRISLAGRSVFYLGVILLALQLVSDAIAPIKENATLASWLAYEMYPILGLLIGIVGTALLQSSSVMVGLAIIAVQQGLLDTTDVVPIVVGSNLGTTSTALIASASVGLVARRAAIANFVFNALGVLAFLPFMTVFARFVVDWVGDGDTTVATVHVLFNIGVAIIGAALLNRVADWLAPENTATA